MTEERVKEKVEEEIYELSKSLLQYEASLIRTNKKKSKNVGIIVCVVFGIIFGLLPIFYYDPEVLFFYIIIQVIIIGLIVLCAVLKHKDNEKTDRELIIEACTDSFSYGENYILHLDEERTMVFKYENEKETNNEIIEFSEEKYFYACKRLFIKAESNYSLSELQTIYHLLKEELDQDILLYKEVPYVQQIDVLEEAYELILNNLEDIKTYLEETNRREVMEKYDVYCKTGIVPKEEESKEE